MWKTHKEGLRLRWRCTSLLASFFTYLLISNAWVTQMRQSTQPLGEMFLYTCHSQASNDQETETAFPSPRSSHRAVRRTVSITIDRGQEKEQVPNVRDILKKTKKRKKGKKRSLR